MRADEKRGFLDLYVTPLPSIEAEACPGLLVLAEDLTERRLLEAQLAQAQKLESIGRSGHCP